MSRFILFAALASACYAFVGRPGEAKQAETPQATYAKVEVRGILRVTEAFQRNPELDSTGGIVLADALPASLTGATITIDKMRPIDVYLDEKELHGRAKKLDGRLVILRGELRMVGIFPKGFYRSGSNVNRPTADGLPAVCTFVKATEVHAPNGSQPVGR